MGLRHALVGTISSTSNRRQPKRTRASVGADVSGGGVRPQGHHPGGSPSPETEEGTDDLGPMWVHSRSRGNMMSSRVKKKDDMLMMMILTFNECGCYVPHTQSLPRRRCLPGQSTSGWTTRMCRVRASLRLKVFSSVHKWHRTLSLRAL